MSASHKAACEKAAEAGSKEPQFKPPADISDRKVASVAKSMRSITAVGDGQEMPIWLGDNTERPPANEVVPVANGLLHIPATGDAPQLHDATPEFFTACGLPCDYEPGADCPLWLDTLRQYFEGDAESIRFLQQWFGYGRRFEAEVIYTYLMENAPGATDKLRGSSTPTDLFSPNSNWLDLSEHVDTAGHLQWVDGETVTYPPSEASE